MIRSSLFFIGGFFLSGGNSKHGGLGGRGGRKGFDIVGFSIFTSCNSISCIFVLVVFLRFISISKCVIELNIAANR